MLNVTYSLPNGLKMPIFCSTICGKTAETATAAEKVRQKEYECSEFQLCP